MSVPLNRNNITTFGDRILYRMSQSYPVSAVDDSPKWRESWGGILAVLEYYMTHGWTFT